MIEEFVAYLRTEKRYSLHTLTAYQSDLSQFLSFVQESYDMDQLHLVTSVMARSWLVHLAENNISAKTINRKLSSVRAFYHYQRKLDRIKVNPVDKISGPKTPKRLPQYLRGEETKQLTSALLFEDDWQGHRDRLMITLMYECGLRRSEVINLLWGDIDQSKLQIKVLGKGNKERIIPTRKELINLISFYQDECKKMWDEHSDYVFTTVKNKKMYPKAVYNVVVKYVGQVSTQSYKGPHLLRHSFATHLTNEGAEIKAIQDLLGHSSLAATQIYTHNSIEKLKRAYKTAHPKA